MQDLPCESIDLLEVSVQLGATFHIFVDEERAFLRSLRYQLAGAPDAAAFLREHYGHLDEARRQQLAAYYTDADGMALQSPLTLGDIAHWVEPVSYTHLDVYKRQGRRPGPAAGAGQTAAGT